MYGPQGVPRDQLRGELWLGQRTQLIGGKRDPGRVASRSIEGEKQAAKNEGKLDNNFV